MINDRIPDITQFDDFEHHRTRLEQIVNQRREAELDDNDATDSESENGEEEIWNLPQRVII